MVKSLTKVLATSVAAGMLVLIPSLSKADGTMTCKYPSSCREIKSTGYSISGKDKIVQYLGVDCITDQGEYVKYIDRVESIEGFMILGKFTNPDKIKFIPWDKNYLECEKDP